MSDKSGQNDPSMNEILGSIKRIITEDSGQGVAPDATQDQDDEDILELTEVADTAGEPRLAATPDAEPEPEVRREPVLGVQRPQPPAEPAPVPAAAAPAPEPAAQPAPRPVSPQPSPAAAVAAGPVEEIVSETATAATASALGELTRAMDEKTSKLKVGAGDVSIADIVKEMLRPMLREWLDENLPGIVERVVRREIQKLVDRAEAED